MPYFLPAQGIAEMSGQGEGDKYSFLEISNPEWLLISGEKEDVKYQDCKELARLHNL